MSAGSGGAGWVSRTPILTSTSSRIVSPTEMCSVSICACAGVWSGSTSFMYQPRQTWMTISAAMIQCSAIETAP